MRTIPLAVLAYEGPMARAYLATMLARGLMPQKILLLVQSHHPVTQKKIGGWLPSSIKLKYREKHQDFTNNYWTRHIIKTYPDLVKNMQRIIEQQYPDLGKVIDQIIGAFSYEDYGRKIEKITIRDLKSPALSKEIAKNKKLPILFTGGGIVPKKLLQLPEIRFLHIHPGHLPHIRGADGLLWSTLVREKPGLTCFYMAPAIDTGDIIFTDDAPSLCFSLPKETIPPMMLYRALFSFYDPLLRAEFLTSKILVGKENYYDLPSYKQDIGQGLTYHFMHEKLRNKALQKIFVHERK